MQIGLFPNPNVDANVEQSRLKKFAELLEKGGTTFQIEEDIQIKRWEKVIGAMQIRYQFKTDR